MCRCVAACGGFPSQRVGGFCGLLCSLQGTHSSFGSLQSASLLHGNRNVPNCTFSASAGQREQNSAVCKIGQNSGQFFTYKYQCGGGLLVSAKRPGSRRGRGVDPARLLSTDGKGRKSMHFRRRQVIFSQGDPIHDVYYIDHGSVKLAVTSKSGKEAVVGLLGAGDFFGESGLNSVRHHTYSASAATDCRVTRIDNRWMGQALSRDRGFSDFFLSYLLSRKARVEADLVDQLFNSSEKRLARALLVMAGYGGRDGKRIGDILPRVSQETLAAMVGTTRSRVSHFMNKFRKLGYVKYNGGLQVRNSLVNILLRD